jgi:PEP-CTERM motif
MSKSMLLAVAASLALSVTAAQAIPTETLTLSGNITSGIDTSGLFGVVGHVFTSLDPYSIQLVYDPTALTNDSCSGPSNNCTWNFGATGLTEIITIAGITKSFLASSGTINYCSCGGSDQIHINTSSLLIGANFFTLAPIFKNQIATLIPANVNNPLALLDFTNLPLLGASLTTSNLGPLQNFNLAVTPFQLSAVYSPGTPVRVPEPASIAMLGAGLASMSLFAVARRRKNTKR